MENREDFLNEIEDTNAEIFLLQNKLERAKKKLAEFEEQEILIITIDSDYLQMPLQTEMEIPAGLIREERSSFISDEIEIFMNNNFWTSWDIYTK